MGDSNNKSYLIKTSNEIMVCILQNRIHMYSRYHGIIKCVDFKPIYYAINLDVMSSSKIFSEFDYLFISDILLV